MNYTYNKPVKRKRSYKWLGWLVFTVFFILLGYTLMLPYDRALRRDAEIERIEYENRYKVPVRQAEGEL